MHNILQPTAEILAELSQYGEAQATIEEIAANYQITAENLEKSFKKHPILNKTYKQAKARGQMALRQMQYQLAKTNAAMAIWLGKQYLGQKDRIENSNGNDTHLQFARIEHVIIDKQQENTRNIKNQHTTSLCTTHQPRPL